MRPLYAIALIGFVATGGIAGEQNDGKRLAEAIAPFVNDQTWIVAHLDLSRVPWSELDALVKRKNQKTVDLDLIATPIKQLVKAGAKDVFVTYNLSVSMSEPFGVIPFGKGADVAIIERITSMMRAKRIGNAFVVADYFDYSPIERIKPNKRPDLEAAFASASNAFARAALIVPPKLRTALVEMMPVLPPSLGGGSTRDIVDGYLWSISYSRFRPKFQSEVVTQLKNENSAKQLAAFWPKLLPLFNKQKDLKSRLPQITEMIRSTQMQQNGNRLVLTMKRQTIDDVFRQMLQEAEATVRQAKFDRLTRNLKNLGLAMHNYSSNQKGYLLPAAANYDAKGKPLLSWRVHILPYLEQKKLYDQFRLDEPWDSEHNKKLIEKMPDVYHSPLAKKVAKGKTG